MVRQGPSSLLHGRGLALQHSESLQQEENGANFPITTQAGSNVGTRHGNEMALPPLGPEPPSADAAREHPAFR